MSAYQLPTWVWPTGLMAVCALAVWRGRDEERLAAAVVLADWALSMIVFKDRSNETQWAVLLVDSCQFAVLSWIALRSARFWPLFGAGFCLLQLVTPLAHALDTGVSAWAYLTATRVWSYLILISIGYGAWTASRSADPPRAYDTAAGGPTEVPGATRR